MKKQYKVYLIKTAALIPAIILLALGISLCLSANLGADLYTSFQKGIADYAGVDVGTMNSIFNICIIAAFLFINRRLINIGSVVVSIGVGPGMTLFGNLLNHYLSDYPAPLAIRILLTCIGTLLISIALSWYISLEVGVQPMDMIIVTIAKVIKKTYGTGMYVFNVLMLIGTLIVGETIGIGTVINFVCVGKLVDIFMPKVKPLVMKMISREV